MRPAALFDCLADIAVQRTILGSVKRQAYNLQQYF